MGTVLSRDLLWELGETHHGFVTAQQAESVGISKQALQMLVRRGTLERAAHGVYRLPRYPRGEHDHLMLAVLWTRVPEAALSHETALDAYGISDINPNRIHITVGRARRFRRPSGQGYVVHYEDLAPQQLSWWDEMSIVTPLTAIEQCLAFGTLTYLLRQAVERGRFEGYLTTAEQDVISRALEVRMGDSPSKSRLRDLLSTLKPKTKAAVSTKVLNAWIAHAEGHLGDEAAGGRLGWLVASSVANAAVQRAIDDQG